ncbi:MAG: polysaccharide biosynthesis protein [Clostridia bacterium]|nr:polysaccharide biosynthesis protein [Clostridia bacterium]
MGKLKKSSFLEGAFIATACIFISKILGIIYVIPFNKIIGEQGGALYGYAYNIYNIFLNISSIGIPFAICKLASEYQALGEIDKKVRMYRLGMGIITVFSVLSFLICFIFASPIATLIIGDIEGGNTISDVVFVIRCISFTLLIVPMLSIKRGYLQGHKYISQPSISQVIEQIVRIIVILVGSAALVYIVKADIKFAVGISVLAAGIGGLASYLYLSRTVSKNKTDLSLDIRPNDKSKDKEIIKAIIVCAVPYIIINIANTLYTTTDMILVLKTLPKLNFTGKETEFVSSVFTTWGTKFNAIITAVSTGLIVSLIPHIVSDYTKGETERVNTNFNKCLKMIILIIAPLSLFISLMADSFWTVFYGRNEMGASIIKFSIIVTVFDCLYMVLNSAMQSLNRKQIIYKSVLSGLAVNLVLDVPLMYLFSYLGLKAYHGAITATLLGFIVSNTLSLSYLKKHMNISFKETLKTLPRAAVSLLVLIILGVIANKVLPTDNPSRLVQIINIAVSGIVCGGVYLIINLKELKTVLPEKLLKKLHLS